MNIIVCKDYNEVSTKAYEVVKNVIVSNQGDCVLGLATGSTPIGLYKNMVDDCKAGHVSYKNIKTVNLDEYIGLDISHNQSYDFFMKDNLFNHIDIDTKNIHLPQGNTADNTKACEDYTNLLDTMQQDIQVLGIGSNGHIGFNEPGTSFDTTTHIVQLQKSTIQDNARFFTSFDEVPKFSITMGIKNIMNAKSILVIASGKNKAQAVHAMIKGEVSELCPASVLQNHANVTVVLDEESASLL